MDKQDETRIEATSESEGAQEWLRLCRELFTGPNRMVEIVRTPPGEERDDLYDIIREVQALLS